MQEKTGRIADTEKSASNTERTIEQVNVEGVNFDNIKHYSKVPNDKLAVQSQPEKAEQNFGVKNISLDAVSGVNLR